ncbi:MAG: sugar transferase [Streptococcaceae bacterium]|nr:sugar transferase [Streptococcaceae bacterium]
MEGEVRHRFGHVEAYQEKLVQQQLIPYKVFGHLELFVKRISDVLGALLGMIPLLIAVIILFFPYHFGNKKDRGPMFYRQKRYGYHGKVFYIIKFRTMIVGAEDYLESHPDIKKLYHAGGNKIPDDPRITKIGKIIRRKSIDELPQFLNVLNGDMSLVGPRPILPFEAEEYGVRLPYLFACRPGITGYWTTHGRNKIFFPERADLELKYLNVHGCLFDLITILTTILQTIGGAEIF